MLGGKFPCSDCDYVSNYKASLKNHRLAMHRSPDDELYNCDKCENQFKTKARLAFHI